MHQHLIEEMADAIGQRLPSWNPELRSEIVAVLRQFWSDKIALVWTTVDVHSQAGHLGLRLTEDEAMRVLNWVHKYQDADVGVNWGTIDSVISELGLEDNAHKAPDDFEDAVLEEEEDEA